MPGTLLLLARSWKNFFSAITFFSPLVPLTQQSVTETTAKKKTKKKKLYIYIHTQYKGFFSPRRNGHLFLKRQHHPSREHKHWRQISGPGENWPHRNVNKETSINKQLKGLAYTHPPVSFTTPRHSALQLFSCFLRCQSWHYKALTLLFEDFGRCPPVKTLRDTELVCLSLTITP